MAKKKNSGKAVSSLVGGAVVPSLIGSAMPSPYGDPLINVGTGFSHFVQPAVTIHGAGMVMDSLKHLPKPKHKF